MKKWKLVLTVVASVEAEDFASACKLGDELKFDVRDRIGNRSLETQLYQVVEQREPADG